MNNEYKKVLGFVLIILALILAVYLYRQQPNDIELCRGIFQGFVEGKQDMEKFVDWEHLKALGLDVGATYSKLANAKEKEAYRREFYKSFARGSRQAGGKFQAVTNWRIYQKGGLETVVSADYNLKSKTVLFTLFESGGKKLINIQWEGAGD